MNRYTQPFSKIHYELDFSLGAEVDIGCGTAVVGDGSSDLNIPKSVHTHPLSRQLFQYQFPTGRPVPNMDPPDVGFFSSRCPRYYRFKVTQPGNFTFDTCASMMEVGIGLLRQTVDLAHSAPRMNISTGRFEEGGAMFEVPLHDNNVQYRTISTGLVDVQTGTISPTMVDWLNAPSRADPNFPKLAHNNSMSKTMFHANGCPMSQSVHRTFYISDVGDYILETQQADVNSACSSFNVKMTCSGDAETVDPADNDPLGFSVDAETGMITGTPKRVRDGWYKMRLRAVDAADKRTDIADWTFNVREPPAFSLNPSARWTAEINGSLESKYHMNETHLLPKLSMKTSELLQHPAGGTFDEVVYLFSLEPDALNRPCNVDVDNDGGATAGNVVQEAISALTDVANGAGALNIQCEGHYTGRLVVRDSAGSDVEVWFWRFEVLPRDTVVATYGPNGKGCEHGVAVDEDTMDGQFTCECGDTAYTGLNCDAAAYVGDMVAIGVVVGLICLAVTCKVHSGKDRRHRLGMARKAADPSHTASSLTDLTDGLLAAVEFGELSLVPALIELGADASARGAAGQLPHADALRHGLQLDNDIHLAAMLAIFRAHCEFDAQIGACIRSKDGEASKNATYTLVEHVLCELARSGWKSPSTGSTVAHMILEGCYKLCLTEIQTVQLLEAVLVHDAAILTAKNNRGKTPTDLAIMCEGMLEIQIRFTVVLFNRYQIVRPHHPLYKSSTAEVHECNDLLKLASDKQQQQQQQQDFNTSSNRRRSSSFFAVNQTKRLLSRTTSDGSTHVDTPTSARCVVKLMSNPDLWLRELQTRDTLGTSTAGSYVGAISAAVAERDNDDDAATAVDPRAAAATQYATMSSSTDRPVTVLQPSSVAETRRGEARTLMQTFPYAIQMPLADRNLNEIISSERLAEEPLEVIQQTSRKLLNLIQKLHEQGVIHGDVKPKNTVRVDRTLMLIDLDMAITVGSPAPPAHANPEKFHGSTAYAAPELHRWMAEHTANGSASASASITRSSPVDQLESVHQIDLWSFACTLYEMASGSPLFQNSYDRASSTALTKLKDWKGLDSGGLDQIKSLHGESESAALCDVLLWSLDLEAGSRPKSVSDLTAHAFFDPHGGAMREHFAVDLIKKLLSGPPSVGVSRVNANVMISYCWADTNFVLSRLAREVASRVDDLWLDRLGGEQGMGEFAKASMKRGVENADVIIAVVSPSYVFFFKKSKRSLQAWVLPKVFTRNADTQYS